MSQAILTALALSAIACSSLAATPAKAHKRRHTVTTAPTTAARKHTPVATKTASAKATKGHKGKVTHRPVRSYQQAPTPDRYREIQQALASKGYYKGDPNGEWGADSSDALKRFQADQSLMPDGKINSLSLIALGLGPKRLSAKSDSAPQPARPAPPPPTAPQ